MLLAVNSNNKSAIKFEKKQSAKNKQISIKTKQPASLKKNATPQKKAKICGKTARLATLLPV